FAFGLFTKYKIKDKLVPVIALAAPIMSYLLNIFCIKWFDFYLGYTLLLFNGIFTFAGLWLIRKRRTI
ncbi:MAG: hypothetical protein B6I20_08195, partial [Bacteroidetes bacterium 4572_117]